MSEKKPKKSGKGSGRRAAASAKAGQGDETLSLYTEFTQLKRKLEKTSEQAENLAGRLEDAEIHINLLTRFVTTICIEKIGMRVGVLKRLLKRVESEAVRDSQIHQLESLYNLPPTASKKNTPAKQPPKKDPWDDIS